MLIVDAQVHIWGSGEPTNAAHRQVPVSRRTICSRRWTRAHAVLVAAMRESVTEELPWLSPRDKELIMGRALCTWID